MGDYQVSCIRRDTKDVDRRIDALGGPSFKTASIDEVIRWIESGNHQFFVGTTLMTRAYLEVKVHPKSLRKYLRTIPDGKHDNNLYSLPECGA